MYSAELKIVNLEVFKKIENYLFYKQPRTEDLACLWVKFVEGTAIIKKIENNIYSISYEKHKIKIKI